LTCAYIYLRREVTGVNLLQNVEGIVLAVKDVLLLLLLSRAHKFIIFYVQVLFWYNY